MQDPNKFLGMDKGNLPVLGLSVITLAVIIILFAMQISAINRLNDKVTAMIVEMREENAATRSELSGDIREVGDDPDAPLSNMDTLDDDSDKDCPN